MLSKIFRINLVEFISVGLAGSKLFVIGFFVIIFTPMKCPCGQCDNCLCHKPEPPQRMTGLPLILVLAVSFTGLCLLFYGWYNILVHA
jgi:hypothetical protein